MHFETICAITLVHANLIACNSSLEKTSWLYFQVTLHAIKGQYVCWRLGPSVYVAVKLLCQVIFVFLLFWGMVMYANEVETKKNKNYLR